MKYLARGQVISLTYNDVALRVRGDVMFDGDEAWVNIDSIYIGAVDVSELLDPLKTSKGTNVIDEIANEALARFLEEERANNLP
jgi:hypothetical protein